MHGRLRARPARPRAVTRPGRAAVPAGRSGRAGALRGSAAAQHAAAGGAASHERVPAGTPRRAAITPGDLGDLGCRVGGERAGCNTSCPSAGAGRGGHPGPVTGKMTCCAAVRRCRPGRREHGPRAGRVSRERSPGLHRHRSEHSRAQPASERPAGGSAAGWCSKYGAATCPPAGRALRAGTAGALGTRARAGDPPAGRRAGGLRPARVRCRACRTHVVLPAWCAPRRAHGVEVIATAAGAALDGADHLGTTPRAPSARRDGRSPAAAAPTLTMSPHTNTGMRTG